MSRIASDETRSKVRERLASVLECDVNGTAVVGVEEAMASMLGAGSKDYMAKARTLVSNLKSNRALRSEVLAGAFAGSALVSASVQDLAPESLKLQRQQSAGL